MEQVDVYKKALRLLEKARAASFPRSGCTCWMAESYLFGGLCRLIYDLSTRNYAVIRQFKRDSETVLGKELDEGVLWFTKIEEDEPKARAERIEHLKKLIKLYGDE